MIIDKASDAVTNYFFNLSSRLESNEFYLKLDGFNLATSIKLKSARQMLEALENEGNIKPERDVIVCSSSGNLAIAVSLLCKEKGYQAICVSDPNILPVSKQYIRLYGAELIIVNERDEMGGYLGARLKLIDSLLENNKNYHFLNQYEDLNNIEAHYSTTAPEISKEFNKLDYLFVGAGTTGTLMGCVKYFKQYRPEVKVIGVDAKGSVTFPGEKPAARKIPGLGTSTPPALADSSQLHDLVYVDEPATIRVCHELVDQYALLVGGSTGSVVSAVKQYEKKIGKDKVVVAISPDFGGKYLDTIYNQAWVDDLLREKDSEEKIAEIRSL